MAANPESHRGAPPLSEPSAAERLSRASRRRGFSAVLVAVALLCAAALIASLIQAGRLSGQVKEASRRHGIGELSRSALELRLVCEASQNELVRHLAAGLGTTHDLLDHAGGVSFEPGQVPWEARQQETGRVVRVTLPRVRIGEHALGPLADPAAPLPFVDEAAALTRTAVTLFQRMNEEGDMLRVATTVRTRGGVRAVGTFIAARGPDGPNPVIAPVLAGKRYEGRAFVVDTWYVTAYEPVLDTTGKVAGMLFVGVPQEGLTLLATALARRELAGEHSLLVVGAARGERGRVLMGTDAGLVGAMLPGRVGSPEGRPFVDEVLSRAPSLANEPVAATEAVVAGVGAGDRVAVYTWFEPWQWAIVVTADRADIEREAAPLRRSITFVRVALVSLVVATFLLGVAYVRRRAMIDALGESEERHRSVVTAMSEGLVVHRADLSLAAANPAAERILCCRGDDPDCFGVDPLAHRVVLSDGTPGTRDDLPIVRALRTGVPEHDVELGLADADGALTWVSLNVELLRRAPGDAPHAVVTTFTDITGRRRQAEALRTALAAEKRFLAGMSHEIRTPLNGVLAFLELLQGASLTDDERSWLGTAHASARHLLSLVNDILDVSKIDAGELEITTEELDLDAIVGECGAILGGRLALGVQLTTTLSGASRLVLGDATRIRQIVLNLLSNAAKFTERGSVRLAASAIDAGDRARVVVDVVDTGIGIPEDKRAGLFQQFRQAHASRYGGTGLGLYLSRSLARMMGGDVTLIDDVPAGSHFRLTLDLAWGADKPAPSTARPANVPRPARKRELTGMRVLVVDDVRMNREVVRELCRVAFHLPVETVSDGAEAIERVRADRFDLVLMDIQMPVIDGAEATRRIRELGIAVPIVGLSASVMAEEREHALRAGMNGFLAKPLQLASLEALLRAHAPAA